MMPAFSLFSVKIDEKTLLVAGGLVILAIWYTRRQVSAVAAAVNPVSADNIFNQAVTKTGAAITGQEDWTLGGALYDLGHNAETNEANIIGDVFNNLTGVQK